MKLVRELDETLWRHWVDGHDQSSIFHTPDMIRVFTQAQHNQPELWAVVDDARQPLALLPLQRLTLIGGPLGWLTTRKVAYGGLLCVPNAAGRAALDLLLTQYRQQVDRRVLFTELRNLFDTTFWRPVLESHGLVYQEHLNYLLDLHVGPQAVLQNIGPRTRKKIRKALRDEHVRIEWLNERARLPVWYDILRQTYDHAHVPLANLQLFEAVFDLLRPQGLAWFALAWVGDAPAACSLELPYRHTIYGWYGGTDRTYSSFYPNEVLMWHVLERGACEGYRVYDFGGAGRPDEAYGVRDFKAKFSGKLVSFGRYVWNHAPLRLTFSQWGYNIYRNMWLFNALKQRRHDRKREKPSARQSSSQQDDGDIIQ